MKKLLICLISLLSITSTYGYLVSDKTLWYGTIVFPHDMQIVPPIRVYYAGTKLNVQMDHDTKQSSFLLTEHKNRADFYILIAGDVDIVTATANTIDYLRVPQATPYSLYRIIFNAQTDTWNVSKAELPEDKHIPDNTIIVRYHPLFVKSIEGGSTYELPRIIIDERILHNLSPEELHDASIHLFLGSLNCDALHAKTTPLVKSDIAHKTVSLILT